MSLMCGCDFIDGPSVFNERLVVARKEHKCSECGTAIKIGEAYRYTFGVWEGAASSFKACEECVDLWDSMTALGYCLTYGELRSDHNEYLSELNKQQQNR